MDVSNTIHNSPRVETTHTSINGQMGECGMPKQGGPYNGRRVVKRKRTYLGYNMVKTRKHAKYKNLITKDRSYDLVYRKCPEQANHRGGK